MSDVPSPLPIALMPMREALMSQACPRRAASLQRFFKTGPGDYAEGDFFLGLTVPVLRQIAKRFIDTPLSDLFTLLHSACHEERLLALLILVARYAKTSAEEQTSIFEGYLQQMAHINNWDLVDLSAPAIVGKHLLSRKRTLLYDLATNRLLWARRIAIVSTWTFIKAGEYQDTLALSGLLLHDDEPLIHKAVGWMLREVGKKDQVILKDFIEAFGHQMARTTLRYAIERFPEPVRRHFLVSTRTPPRRKP